MAAHRVGVALRVAELAIGHRRLGDEGAQPRVVGLVGEVSELLVGDGELFSQLLEPPAHFGEAALDVTAGHDLGFVLPAISLSAMRARLVSIAALAAAALVGCSSSTATGCANQVREPLDPSSGVHLLDPSQGKYQTDPPTSGPHLFRVPPPGVIDRTLLPAEQVSVLEAGGVLVQYRDAADADAVATLAGGPVTVAPNPALPKRIVATAWTYKMSCASPDLAKLRSFIRAHSNKATGH